MVSIVPAKRKRRQKAKKLKRNKTGPEPNYEVNSSTSVPIVTRKMRRVHQTDDLQMGRDEKMETVEKMNGKIKLVEVGKQIIQGKSEKFQPSWCQQSMQNLYWKKLRGYRFGMKKMDLMKVVKLLEMEKKSIYYQHMVLYALFVYSIFNFVLKIPLPEVSRHSGDQIAAVSCIGLPGLCSGIKNKQDVYDFIRQVSNIVCATNQTVFDSSENVQRMQPWVRLGDIQVRQIRAKSSKCMVGSKEYACYSKVSARNTLRDSIVGEQTKRMYHWQEHLPQLMVEDQTSLLPSGWNQVTDFGHGGFLINDVCAASSRLNLDLQEEKWIDFNTRVLNIQFNLMSPASQTFVNANHVFVFDQYGTAQYVSQGSSFRLLTPFAYATLANHDTNDIVLVEEKFVPKSAIWAIVLLVFVASFWIQMIQEVRKKGRLYLYQAWNVFSVVQIVQLTAMLYFYYVFYAHSNAFIEQYLQSHNIASLIANSHTDLAPTAQLYNSFLRCTYYGAMIGLFKILYFIRISSTFYFVWNVLRRSLHHVFGFLAISGFSLLAHAALGYLQFGNLYAEFSSPGEAFRTAFLIGFTLSQHLRYDTSNHSAAGLGVFRVSLLFSITLAALYLIVGILVQYWKAAAILTDSSDEEYDIYHHLLGKLKTLSPEVLVPPNEVVHLTEGQIVYLASSNILDQERKRQQARKRFRCAVWHILALLRFGVKFDTFLKVGNVHQWITTKDKESFHSIRLSSNFDHNMMKHMLVVGSNVKLVKQCAVVKQAIQLKVKYHGEFYTACEVLQTFKYGDCEMELVGGERLQVSWLTFLLFFLRVSIKYFLSAIISPIYSAHRPSWAFIPDEHLETMFNEAMNEGHKSLRYDEVYYRIEILCRRTKKMVSVSNREIGKQAALIMMRFYDALYDMPSREREGHDYIPSPQNTSSINTKPFESLVELLSANCHDLWAMGRINSGWKWGRGRDDNLRLHPNLIPYSLLSSTEKDYDRRTAIETLKTIYLLQFQILAEGGPVEEHSFDLKRILSSLRKSQGAESDCFCLYHGEKRYYAQPIDASHVQLPSRLLSLAHLLAENTHEVWSVARMNDGWTYGPQRNDRYKKHPCLVPYVFLTDEEKEYDFNTAIGTLKTLIAAGFRIQDRSAT